MGVKHGNSLGNGVGRTYLVPEMARHLAERRHDESTGRPSSDCTLCGMNISSSKRYALGLRDFESTFLRRPCEWFSALLQLVFQVRVQSAHSLTHEVYQVYPSTVAVNHGDDPVNQVGAS
jgi:hypothetical protein